MASTKTVSRSRNALLVLMGAVLGGSLMLGESVFATRQSDDILPLEQMRAFTDVFTRIKSNYVEEVSDDELLEHAIRGMLNGLDPHSSYLNTEEFNELRIGTTGEFGGLGICLLYTSPSPRDKRQSRMPSSA